MISLVSDFWYQQGSQVEEGCEFSYIQPKLQATGYLTLCDCKAYKDRALLIRKKAGVFLHLLCSIHKKLLSLPFFFKFLHLLMKQIQVSIFIIQICFQGFCQIQFPSLDLVKNLCFACECSKFFLSINFFIFALSFLPSFNNICLLIFYFCDRYSSEILKNQALKNHKFSLLLFPFCRLLQRPSKNKKEAKKRQQRKAL